MFYTLFLISISKAEAQKFCAIKTNYKFFESWRANARFIILFSIFRAVYLRTSFYLKKIFFKQFYFKSKNQRK